MLRYITNEIEKVRTLRTWWLFLLAQLILVVVGVSGRAAQGIVANDPTVAGEMVAHAGILSLFSLIFGLNAVATEYRHRTITDTFLAVPKRWPVLVAKLTVYTGIGVGYGIACVSIAVAATVVWFAVKGVPLDLNTEIVRGIAFGAVAWNALFAAVGVSLGALVTNLNLAIGVAFGWIALVEGLVGQLLGEAAKWLPMASGRALGNMPGDLLPQATGGLVLAGYAILLAVIAAATSLRRDVT